MTRSVIWRCPCDGQQHLATLTGNDQGGYHVRTFCGKTTDTIRLTDLLPNGEVTCPACHTEETLAALVKDLAA
jgi:hypothetical protein